MANWSHRIIPPNYEPFAFESITVTSAAVGLTAATFVNAQAALITVETKAITWRADGTAASAAVGHKAVATDAIPLGSANEIQRFSAFESGAGDATIRVTYYQ